MSTTPISPVDAFGDSPKGDILPPLVLRVMLGSDAEKRVFFGLHLVSILACFGLASTMIFSKLPRYSSLLNYLLINCTLSIFSIIRVFSVSADQLDDPSSPLGVFQASLIMGGGWAVGFADCFLALLIVCKVCRPGTWLSKLSDSRFFGLVLNAVPWIVWSVVSIVVGVLGHLHRDWVQFVGFWFNVTPFLYPWLYGILAMFSLTILLDLIIAYHLIIHTRGRKSSFISSNDATPSLNPTNPPANLTTGGRRRLTSALTQAERVERLKWAALAGRVVALGIFFVVNSVMIELVVRLNLNANKVLLYEAIRGITISCIFVTNFDILNLYRTFFLSLFSSLRHSPRNPTSSSSSSSPSSRNATHRQSQLDRRFSTTTVSVSGPCLSYSNSNASLDHDAPVSLLSKPLGSLVDIFDSKQQQQQRVEMYEMKDVDPEKGGEVSEGEFDVWRRGQGVKKPRTTSNGGVHVQVEVERHEGTSYRDV